MLFFNLNFMTNPDTWNIDTAYNKLKGGDKITDLTYQ